MLHAIPEADVEDFSHPRQENAHDPLSSDGSLSEPRSDALRDRSAGGGSVGFQGSPDNIGDDSSRLGMTGLLALVETERNKMSKAVLASADGLSAAVALARKRLAANIAAVEEQLREERQQLEESRLLNRSIATGLSPISPAGTILFLAMYINRSNFPLLLIEEGSPNPPVSTVEYEATIERLQAQKRTVENERDTAREQLESAIQELSELRRRSARFTKSHFFSTV